MLKDYELFARLCEKRGISLTPEISDAIKVSSITGELRLSCLSIMIPVCEILAQTLVSSCTIKTVDLSDCMLLSKGLTSVLDALCEGTAVTTLHLKGNNMSGHAVARLGDVFIRNNTLKRLHVEWNSIGADADAFAAFCDGLAKNHNIEQLDLRYNQISQHCAEHLRRMICGNRSLRNVDLSWNTLGPQGGRLLLNAMRDNKTLVELALRGNYITGDIVVAIDERLRENRSHVRATSELASSADARIARKSTRAPQTEDFVASAINDELPLEITRTTRRQKSPTPRRKETVMEPIRTSPAPVNITEFNDRSPIDSSIDANAEIDENSEEEKKKVDCGRRINTTARDPCDGVVATTLETDAKIADLGEMLGERNAMIDLLKGENATKVAEVEDARAQLNLLQTQIDRLQGDKERFDAEKAREIAELRKSHNETEEDWRRNYTDLKNNYGECEQGKTEAESKIRRYEEEIHKSSLKIGFLRKKLASVTRVCEDLLLRKKTEMHRLRRESKERDNKHRIELNLLRNTLKETTQALEDCQIELQKSRSESRDLCKNQALLKTKLDDAERKILRYAKLEKNCQKIDEERNTLEEKLANSQRIASALQRQVTHLQSELIEPQRRQDLLKEELQLEKQMSERLKQELREEGARLKEQNLQVEKMNQQIGALNTQLNEVQTMHAKVLHECERERKQFQDIISNKERNLSELRAGEVQRAGQLYAAFSKYLSSIDPSSIS